MAYIYHASPLDMFDDPMQKLAYLRFSRCNTCEAQHQEVAAKDILHPTPDIHAKHIDLLADA